MKTLAIALLFIAAGFGAQAQTKTKKPVQAKKETKACLSKGKSCCNDKALSALRRPVAKPVAAKKN